jgi:hypothetical protein
VILPVEVGFQFWLAGYDLASTQNDVQRSPGAHQNFLWRIYFAPEDETLAGAFVKHPFKFQAASCLIVYKSLLK